MSFAKCFFLLLLCAFAHALATPHLARSPLHHRALARRAASPVPLHLPSLPVRKRSSGKRCKPRPSSSAPLAVSATPVANVAPTPSALSSSVVPETTQEKPSSSKPAPTTSAQEQPQPTTTTKAQPTTEKPTTTEEKPATTAAPTTTKAEPTTQAAQTTASSDLPSFMIGTQTGQGTFYATGLGACGIVNTDADFIAAASKLLFDNFPGYTRVNPNNNPICNRKVKATYQGKSVTVAITDRCEACAITDLDFSPAAFNTLADPAVGRISGMTWDWL